jgi:hypothetical protein
VADLESEGLRSGQRVTVRIEVLVDDIRVSWEETRGEILVLVACDQCGERVDAGTFVDHAYNHAI